MINRLLLDMVRSNVAPGRMPSMRPSAWSGRLAPVGSSMPFSRSDQA